MKRQADAMRVAAVAQSIICVAITLAYQTYPSAAQILGSTVVSAAIYVWLRNRPRANGEEVVK